MKLRMIGILGLIIIIISGCAESRTIEKSGVISIYGVDVTESDQLNTTAVFHKFGPEDKGLSRIITGRGETLSEGQKQMNYKLGFQLEPGAIQLELFGKKAAENGLIGYLQDASRHPRASNTRLLAVSDTTANDLMEKVDQSPDVDINRSLPDVINVNDQQNVLPKETLHSFQHFYYEPGADPVLPILSYQSKGPKLTALALFKGDKLAGKIPVDQAFYINVFRKTIHGLGQQIQLPLQPFKKHLQEEQKNDQNHFYTLFNIKTGKSKTKLVDKQNLHFQTKLDFDVTLLELTESVDLEGKAAIDVFEQETEKAIKQQYEQLLAKLQERNIDPMGYGKIYKTKKRDGILTESEWRDKFPDITVDVDVDVDILNYGM